MADDQSVAQHGQECVMRCVQYLKFVIFMPLFCWKFQFLQSLWNDKHALLGTNKHPYYPYSLPHSCQLCNWVSVLISIINYNLQLFVFAVCLYFQGRERGGRRGRGSVSSSLLYEYILNALLAFHHSSMKHFVRLQNYSWIKLKKDWRWLRVAIHRSQAAMQQTQIDPTPLPQILLSGSHHPNTQQRLPNKH